MKAWVLGDNVDTDAIAPGRYMKCGIDEIARHCLETLDPAFAASVRKGDVVVAEALKHLGVAALIAESYAGLFYRNAINLGLPALVCAQAKRIRPRDDIAVDLDAARIDNRTTGETLAAEPLPAFLRQIVRDGGLLAHLERRLRGERASA